jgi:UPF0271 protein
MGSETLQTCIDLNCDLGEYEQLSRGHNDAAIMAYISSCNIACGGHAGNQAVIEHTVGLALSHGVNIGAHPAYPDSANFGRKAMNMPVKALQSTFLEQIQTIKYAAEAQGGKLSHVKPHGALYNQAADDLQLALLLVETVAEVDSKALIYGLADSKMQQAADRLGVQFVAEGFADRAYTQAATLVPRIEAGAVITDVSVMFKQVLQMMQKQCVVAITGEEIPLRIDTLCVHGDHPNAIQTAQCLSQGLKQAGFQIQAPQVKPHHV